MLSRASRSDLHTHTTASDGTLTPAELVRLALDRGLEVLAVTDHDTVAGVAPAIEAAAGTGLRVLPGVELSALYSGGGLHLLGYGFDPGAGGLDVRLRALTMGREERARAILRLLATLGAPLSWDRVALSGTAVRAMLRAGELPPPEFSRPEVARVLVEALHGVD